MEFIVVGAGWAGERHVKAIQALAAEGAEARVAALVDVDATQLAQQAGAWGIAATFGSPNRPPTPSPENLSCASAGRKFWESQCTWCVI